jgi:hypothetical protein
MKELPPYLNMSLQDIEGEEWRDILGWEGYYQVSNMGRVKSLERIIEKKNGVRMEIEEKIKKQGNNGLTKTCTVTFSINDKAKTYIVSRLVYKSFNPSHIEETKKFILHKNYDPSDNRLINLIVGEYDRLSNPISFFRKNKYSVKYKGVDRNYNGSIKQNRMRICINNDIIEERFNTPIEAAKKYDYYVKKYKLNRELNFPDE